MREILFRGKRVDNGEWIEGYYIGLHKTTYCFEGEAERNKENEIHQIVFEQMTDWDLPNKHLRVDVLPETVGQYTGLTDKNGAKIFEGDILVTPLSYIGTVMDIVEYKNGSFVHKNGRRKNPYLENGSASRIIGNIHDNPELLEGVRNG